MRRLLDALTPLEHRSAFPLIVASVDEWEFLDNPPGHGSYPGDKTADDYLLRLRALTGEADREADLVATVARLWAITAEGGGETEVADPDLTAALNLLATVCGNTTGAAAWVGDPAAWDPAVGDAMRRIAADPARYRAELRSER